MNRYIPLTVHDSTIPALVIDTEAPIEVLHDTAAYRIQAVTQLLETLALRNDFNNAVVLHEFLHLLAIPLRDGCDLLDIIGRKLKAQL